MMPLFRRLSVCFGFAVFVSSAGNLATASRAPVSAPKRYLVMMVMDGFRPDYMNLAPMRHLHALVNRGTSYSQAWVGQEETETPTGHATLVTGVFPRRHGVLGFGWRDQSGQNFDWLPTDLRRLAAGSMESLIESAGVPSIADLVHRQDPTAKVASISGEKYYAADAMGVGADYILYGRRSQDPKNPRIDPSPVGDHAPPASAKIYQAAVKSPAYAWVQDRFVADVAVRLLKSVQPRVMLLNFPGPDIEGHVTGGPVSPHDMRREVRALDQSIGTVVNAYRHAGLMDRTVFVVTADHGMIPNSHQAPIKSMYAGVRETGASWLEDDFLGTAGYVYLRDPQQAQMVASSLVARHFPAVEGALYRVATPSGYKYHVDSVSARLFGRALSRAYTDLSNTFASASSPDVVLPYSEDTMGLHLNDSPHHGNHGGLSWGVQHIPLFFSGPGIRRGSSSFPAQLVDVAPTLEQLLGLSVPHQLDGVALTDALVHSSAGDRAAQRLLSQGRLQDIRALRTHSMSQGALTLGTG